MTDLTHKNTLMGGRSRFDDYLKARAGELYLNLVCRVLRRRLGSPWVDRFIYGPGLFPSHVVREVNRFGYRMRVDLHDQIGRMIYFLGSHEPDESDRVRAMIQPDWVVVDVGAQIGFYTLMSASRIDPHRGHVYALEPNPKSLEKLRYHVQINDLSHVTVIPKAVAAERGTATFYPGPEHNTGLASRFDRGYDATPITVEQTTIDDLAAEHGWTRLDLLKVDAEGCETAVIAGAANTLERFKPVLLMELNEPMLTRAETSGVALVQRLRELGYSLREFDNDERELSDDDIRSSEFLNVVAMCR